MKRIKLVFGSAFMALMAGMMASCGSSSRYDTLENVDYIPVKSQGADRWSFYAPDGTEKYTEEFTNRPSVVYNGYFTVQEGDGYTLYKAANKPEPVKDCEGLKDVGVMNEGLIPVTRPEQRITLIDGSGNVKVTLNPVEKKEIVACHAQFSEGLLGVRDQDGKWGYVNKSGNAVIKPQYSDVYQFSDGLAVVASEDNDGETSNLVIDKKGEKVGKIRKGDQLISRIYKFGYLVARNTNGICMFLDKKLETAYKCPSKVKYIADYDDKYFVYNDENGKAGVMTLGGESVIRAKYNNITIIGNGKFLANDDKIALVLNEKDDEELRIEDFERVAWAGKFGFFGENKNTYSFIDDKGKERKNAEYEDVGSDLGLSNCYSDYIDINNAIVEVGTLVNDKGVDKYAIGEAPSVHFKDPESYIWEYKVSLEELRKSGYKFEIKAAARFSEAMARYSDYGTKEWNPQSKLEEIEIVLNAEFAWKPDYNKMMADKLVESGFKITKEVKNESTYAAILTKGNISIVVYGTQGLILNIGSSDRRYELYEGRFNLASWSESYSYSDRIIDELGLSAQSVAEDAECYDYYEVAADTVAAW